jgi:hypothetical protein
MECPARVFLVLTEESIAFVEAFRGLANRILYTDTAHRRIEYLASSAEAAPAPTPMGNVLDVPAPSPMIPSGQRSPPLGRSGECIRSLNNIDAPSERSPPDVALKTFASLARWRRERLMSSAKAISICWFRFPPVRVG